MLTPHTQILRLARSGSPERAWALMMQHGLLDLDSDPKALTLQARLVKDLAKRASAGAEQARLFDQSAQLYARAAGLTGASYPLINAASLSLMAGKPLQAQRFAQDVLDLIAADPAEGETPYWREATRAEALLLLDGEVEARAALRKAIALQPYAWEDHAATIGQFALILAETGRDAGWLEPFRPPPSVHFSGMAGLAPDEGRVGEAIAQFIATERPGFAYGALAAGSDLIFAEAFLAWRSAECPVAELHVVLPYPVDRFRQTSVAAFGEHWVARFDTVLEQATSTTAYGLDGPSLALAVEYADWVAMGRAVRNAQVLASRACAVTVLGEGETLRPQLASWREGGRQLTIIPGVRSGAAGPEASSASPPERWQILVWAGASAWSIHDDLLAASVQACGLASHGDDSRVAMMLVLVHPDRPVDPLLQRAAALAAGSVPGAAVCDEGTAMALIRAGWSGMVDELGELPLPTGREPIWSVRPA